MTVFLPNPSEGFYLPPIEGMASGTLVVCPEHDGERSIYDDGRNCLRPAYGLEELAAAAEAALALDEAEAEAMRERARATAEEHDLPVERQAFLDVLRDIDQLW